MLSHIYIETQYILLETVQNKQLVDQIMNFLENPRIYHLLKCHIGTESILYSSLDKQKIEELIEIFNQNTYS